MEPSEEHTFGRRSSGEVEEGEVSSDDASEEAKVSSLRSETEDKSLSPDSQVPYK